MGTRARGDRRARARERDGGPGRGRAGGDELLPYIGAGRNTADGKASRPCTAKERNVAEGFIPSRRIDGRHNNGLVAPGGRLAVLPAQRGARAVHGGGAA